MAACTARMAARPTQEPQWSMLLIAFLLSSSEFVRIAMNVACSSLHLNCITLMGMIASKSFSIFVSIFLCMTYDEDDDTYLLAPHECRFKCLAVVGI